MSSAELSLVDKPTPRSEQERLLGEFAVPARSIIVIYCVSERQLQISTLGNVEIPDLIKRLERDVDWKTGAVVYRIEDVEDESTRYYTSNDLAQQETISIAATDYHRREYPKTIVPAKSNLKIFERWLLEQGDEESAKKIRDFFPAIFPSAPQSAPKKKWRLWR